MRKALTLLCMLALMSVLLIVPSYAASECTDFDDTYQGNCACTDGGSWNGVEWYEAGDGYTVYIDVCNECFTEYTYKVWSDHDYHQQTINGNEYMVCDNCGGAYLVSSGSDTGNDYCNHYYRATVTPPTCEEEGYTWYECMNCGDAYVGDRTPVTEHSYVHVMTIEPMCTKSGYVHYECSVCGVPPSAEVGYTPPLGHDWAIVSTVIDEDQQSVVTSTCKVCGVTKTETFSTEQSQATTWLLKAIDGTWSGLLDMYQILADGIVIGGLTLGGLISVLLGLAFVVLILVIVFKWVI